MDIRQRHSRAVTRRHFLRNCNAGLGGVALSSLLGEPARGATGAAAVADPLAPQVGKVAPKAKRVIYLHMAGSPPGLDMFDWKPELKKRNMQPCPDSFFEGVQLAFTKGHPNLLGSPYEFKRHGKSGQWLCELFEHFPEVIDEVAVIKSMHTEQFNHAPAQLLLYTGSAQFGGASMGPGRPTASVARMPTCPASSSSSPVARILRGARACGGAVFYPRPTRGCSAAARASRSSTYRTPRG